MYERYVKRGIDFILALIILPFVLFVIVIMTPFILISDPGPIFDTCIYNHRTTKTNQKYPSVNL